MINVGTQVVPIGSVKKHPNNPRRGNIDVIVESLEVNGQYKSIVVQQSTGYILAGNHTWQAAKKLGWSEIAVTFLDVDDTKALQILLADNRASDAGYTDNGAALMLLSTLPTLEGTGYVPGDLRLPGLEPEMVTEPEPAEPLSDATPTETRKEFQVGSVTGWIDPDAYKAWREELPKQKQAALAEVLERLGLVEPPRETPQTPMVETEVYPLADLIPYPGNPRQGDIGLLVELLETHGQYRPVVVNRRNLRILAGNHVARAALQLGWETIGVSWVDVDSDGEKRIVLVDNRSSDLSTYDKEEQGQALAQLGSVDGTGYRLEDLEELLSGNGLRPAARQAGVCWVKVGDLKAKVKVSLVQALHLTVGQELVEAAQMLGINPQNISV